MTDLALGGRSAQGVKLGYRPALDGLRALAVGLVYLNHTGIGWFAGGDDGVVIFFVLSGFLITKLLLEEWGRRGHIDKGRFYARRLIRLVPAVMVLCVVAVVLGLTVLDLDAGVLLAEAALAFFYLTNLHTAFFGGFDAAQHTLLFEHTWSLAIEEHFYLVWPFLLGWLRLPDRNPVTVARRLTIIGFAIGALRLAADLGGVPDLMLFSPLRFDGFAFGAALAFLFHAGAVPRLLAWFGQTWVALGALGLILVDTVAGRITHETWPGAMFTVYTCLLSLAAIAHLASAPSSRVTRFFERRPVVYLGKLSYSLYLWHVPVFSVVTEQRYPSWPHAMQIGVKALLPFPLAMASYHLVEMRFVAMRQRWRA